MKLKVVVTSNSTSEEEPSFIVDWIEEDEDSDKLYNLEVFEEEKQVVDSNDKQKPLRYKKFPRFKMPTDGKQVRFKLALDFALKAIAKDAIHNYSLYQVKPIWIDKDDKKRVVVKCKEGCVTPITIVLVKQL